LITLLLVLVLVTGALTTLVLDGAGAGAILAAELSADCCDTLCAVGVSAGEDAANRSLALA
jgi:hypothetical protein